jgi:hypothetical protein
MRLRICRAVDGRPGGRVVWVQWRAMRLRCHRSSVSGVTSQPLRRGRGSAAAIAPRRDLSSLLSAGRSICRLSTASWWRSATISRSLLRRERNARRASAGVSRYRMWCMRHQGRSMFSLVNSHVRIFGPDSLGSSGVFGGCVVVDCVARGAPDAVGSLGGVESFSLCGLA